MTVSRCYDTKQEHWRSVAVLRRAQDERGHGRSAELRATFPGDPSNSFLNATTRRFRETGKHLTSRATPASTDPGRGGALRTRCAWASLRRRVANSTARRRREASGPWAGSRGAVVPAAFSASRCELIPETRRREGAKIPRSGLILCIPGSCRGRQDGMRRSAPRSLRLCVEKSAGAAVGGGLRRRSHIRGSSNGWLDPETSSG